MQRVDLRLRFRFQPWRLLFSGLLGVAHFCRRRVPPPPPKNSSRRAAWTTPSRLCSARSQLSSTDADSYNLLCRAYFMLEEWDRGIATCERARNLDPHKSLYHLWLGRIYGEKADRAGFLSAAGLAKKVRSSFERAVELDPESWEARADLAEFYLEAPGIVGGGKDKAQAQADAIATLNPALAHWIAAHIAAKNHDSASAEREYRAAIAANQTLGRAWVDLAGLLLRS